MKGTGTLGGSTLCLAALTLAAALLLAGSLLAREASAASYDQTAVAPVTINGCDGKRVTMRTREYEVFKLHNHHRASKGLPLFCVDVDVQREAQWHSDEMAERNYYAHQNPEGRGTGTRLFESGYSCFPVGAENIAVKLPRSTANDYVQSWLASDGHRGNIEDPILIRVGIGSANDADFGAWYYGRPDYGEYVNYTVAFTGNDCVTHEPEPDPGTDPGDGTTPPSDGTDPDDPFVPDPDNGNAPVIENLLPAAASVVRDRTPSFSATVRDADTNLGEGDVSVYIDGRGFSNFAYSASTDRLSGVSRKLAAGKRHTIKIVAKDGAGKSAAKSTTFKVR